MNHLPLNAYVGSNAELTKALYAQLAALGPIGAVAMNLFRAQKASARAKVYHGRQYKDAAYSKKDWSLQQLCDILEKHAGEMAITWGWKEDPMQPYHSQVLYVDLPTGQASFHPKTRGKGPDYKGDWDNQKDRTATRIIQWCSQLLSTVSTESMPSTP